MALNVHRNNDSETWQYHWSYKNSVTYIQLNPCASLVLDLPMFTYKVKNGVSVSAELDFGEGTVGGLQNIFVGARWQAIGRILRLGYARR